MTAELERILEGALFAAAEAMTAARLAELFEEHERPEPAAIQAALEAIAAHWQGRGVQLVRVASGWRFQVCDDLATWVNRLWEDKPQRYSRALLETLALIAYRQPLTRGDIEEVRGVAVSSQIIRTLAERDWIRVVGHREVPGRPALYATTRAFLDYFGLKSLEELPTLSELREFDNVLGEADADATLTGEVGEEPSADQKEPSADQNEPSADRNEPSADMNEPSVDTDEPSAGNDEPSGGSSESAADSDGPLADAADAPSMELREQTARGAHSDAELEPTPPSDPNFANDAPRAPDHDET